MANAGGFKHIKVTPAEQEDVIIRAGAVAQGDQGDAGSDSDAAALAGASAILEGASDAQEVERSCSDGESAEAVSASRVRTQERSRPTEKRSAAKVGKGPDDYSEPTLDDLEGPMPLAQKIVIIAAIVLIIGAVVYYFMVMR